MALLHQVINSGHTAHTAGNDSGPNGDTANGIVTDWPLPGSTNDDETSSKFDARRSCLPRKVSSWPSGDLPTTEYSGAVGWSSIAQSQPQIRQTSDRRLRSISASHSPSG